MDSTLPIIFALSAAAIFGITFHIQQLALDDTNPVLGSFLSVLATAVCFWLVAPFALEVEWLFTKEAVYFLGIGILAPALGQTLQIASVPRVGPSLTASLNAFAPSFSVVLAIFVLSEMPNGYDYLGIALMTAALFLAGWNPKSVPRSFPLWVLLLPLSAAAVRGGQQTFSRLVMEELPSPYFATLMSSTMAAFVLFFYWLWAGRGKKVGSKGVKVFLLAGAVNGVAIFMVNKALQLGEVALVSPLAATTSLWALLYSVLIFKRETLGLKHLVVASLVIVGVVFIV